MPYRAHHRLHANLTQVRCGYHHTTTSLASPKGLGRIRRLLAGDAGAAARVARGRLRHIRELNRQISDLTAEIAEEVAAPVTTLTEICAIGAADIVTEVGDPARFAALRGLSEILCIGRDLRVRSCGLRAGEDHVDDWSDFAGDAGDGGCWRGGDEGLG